jgi:hypothetical protein
MMLEAIENESIVYDLETPRGCFLASFLPVNGEEYTDFIISKERNDLYKLIKYLEINKDRYFVGFNNVSFDGQVLEFIYEKYQEWFDLTSEEIARKISDFATKVIDDSNYGLFPPYREDKLTFKQIDAPRIFHWFNENRRVSLKQAEYELRAENIENFEIDPKKEEFTQEEIDNLVYYCHNDVRYTREVFMHVLGKTSHPLYTGRNKIADRVNFMKEVNLKCLNWDDVKIGAEWNKLDYLKATGKDIKDLKPKKVNHYYGKKYKTFFPKTVEFQTESLRKFVEDLGKTPVLAEKQEFVYTFNKGLVVTVAKGGLHSQESPRILRPTDKQLLLQNDIGSQYPNAMVKYNVFPKHLGKPWITMIIEKISRRLRFKKKYKETKDPIYNSLQETGKYSLNGGAYGRLGTPGDWQEDPCAMLTVTLGCQLEILMIVEALVLKGFNVTSCNTDGWDCIVDKDRLDEYFDIVDYYEEKIGNKESGNIEYTVFAYMAQLSVNDYISEKLGVYEKRVFYKDKIVTKESEYPHLKLKGDFTVDFELHKNSSFRIIPLALVNYFANGKEPEEYINKHNDIFDFCARSNSGKIYEHMGFGKHGTVSLPKIIRYYPSKDGMMIKKMVKQGNMSGARDQNVNPAEYTKTVCNRLPKSDYDKHLQNVDRSFFIEKAKELIFKVEHGRKPKRGINNPNQTSLF